MKYEVIIDWSDEDDAFVADVPELTGCMRTARLRRVRFIARRRRWSFGLKRPGSSVARFRSRVAEA
jgi:hypothetical protein